VRIVRVAIENFRGIRAATVELNGTTVLLGDNNTGKSTLLEAIELAIGPDRLARAQAIDEHDFFGGCYLSREGENPNICIEVVIAGLDERHMTRVRANLSWPALGPGSRWTCHRESKSMATGCT
jgi:putative ATP-dependent endonuclease of OLD family